MEPLPRWRPITWFVLAVNALFPLWVLHGLSLSNRPYCYGDDTSLCRNAVHGAASSPLLATLLLWLGVDILLAAVWLLSRRPSRTH